MNGHPSAFPTPQQAKGRLAGAASHGADEKTLTDLRRDLAAAKIAAAIERTLADAPPLNDAQRSALHRLLDGAR